MKYLYEESETVNNWTDLVPVDVPDRVKSLLEYYFPGLKYIEKRAIDSQYKTIHKANVISLPQSQ